MLRYYDTTPTVDMRVRCVSNNVMTGLAYHSLVYSHLNISKEFHQHGGCQVKVNESYCMSYLSLLSSKLIQ